MTIRIRDGSLRRRRVEVPVRYRDEAGTLVEETLEVLVDDGEAEAVVRDRVPSHTEIIGATRSREVPGDWIPLGHVPLELLPEPDYGPEEWEPDPGDTRTRGTRP